MPTFLLTQQQHIFTVDYKDVTDNNVDKKYVTGITGGNKNFNDNTVDNKDLTDNTGDKKDITDSTVDNKMILKLLGILTDMETSWG